MSIMFAGGSAYEFGGVASLSTVAGRYDPDFAEGAIVKTNPNFAVVNLPYVSAENEMWIHTKAWLSKGGYNGNTHDVFILYSETGAQLAGLRRASGEGYTLFCGSTTFNLAGMNYDVLSDIDIHYFAETNRRCVEIYQNGSLVATAKVTGSWTPANSFSMGAPNSLENFYSEIIVTEGNEPTIGWRLHTKRPDPALPGLNSFDSGYWGSLANDSMESGVATTSELARVTGGFAAYTGPATPIGIRGIMQTGRFIKNSTLLNLHGQLRIGGANYDAPDKEFRDTTRLFSLWEKNPATDAPFQVSDLAGLQGGFYTSLDD